MEDYCQACGGSGTLATACRKCKGLGYIRKTILWFWTIRMECYGCMSPRDNLTPTGREICKRCKGMGGRW